MSAGQPGFQDVQDRLRDLSAQGDPREGVGATVDFEIFRAGFMAALGSRCGSKGGHPIPRYQALANAAKSAVHAHAKHSLTPRKGLMRLVLSTIGLAQASAAFPPANAAHNTERLCRPDRRGPPARGTDRGPEPGALCAADCQRTTSRCSSPLVAIAAPTGGY